MHRINIYLILSFQLLIAGGTHIVAKAVVASVNPATLLFLRTVFSVTAMMLAGTLAFFPFGLFFSIHFPFSELNAAEWSGVLYLALGTSVLGYLLWYYALGRIDTAKVAVFTNGQPIVATILSFIFLDYSITGNFIIGGVLTIVGVVITQLG